MKQKLLLLALISAFAFGIHAEEESKEKTEKPKWETASTPIDLPGAKRLHKVSAILYRGAQPTAEGFRGIEKLGVKLDVNLRSLHSDRKLIAGTKLKYIHFRTTAWDVDEKNIIAFLKIVTKKENQPVFVHCKHGVDRTGVNVAAYRIVVQGWDKEDAIKEMHKLGKHGIWKNLDTYLRKMDVKKIRKAVGVKAAAAKDVKK